MRRVVWSPRSVADLTRITAYLELENPHAALRLQKRLQDAVLNLQTHPDRGRIRGKLRELTIVSPYIIRYRVETQQVVVLRIRHGARRPD